ncbi:Uncharacterized protein pbN1_36450 [Aromatoleum bremense]|nr:Uncharacterized protein pbN1_36450 [Aromatoleum bremense]
MYQSSASERRFGQIHDQCAPLVFPLPRRWSRRVRNGF